MFRIGVPTYIDPSFRFEFHPTSQKTPPVGTMADEMHKVQVKHEKQQGIINIEDVSIEQWWFPIHLKSAGSIVGIGVVLIVLFCIYRTCRKKMCIKLYNVCLSCRKQRDDDTARREEERILELLACGTPQDVDLATTSHHHGHGHGRG